MNKPYLVGITGGSGSGKTTFINELFKAMPVDSLALVSQDNYYLPPEQQQADDKGELNFDLPTSIDRQHFHQDILTLLSGKSITKREYNFNNPKKEPKLIEVGSAPIIITEGLFIFHYEEIRNMLDHRVYIHAHEEIRLQRRISRDDSERGIPEQVVIYQWENHVLPADMHYLQPYIKDSHHVVDNSVNFQKDLERLVDHLKVISQNR